MAVKAIVVVVLLSESYSFVTPVKGICNESVHCWFVCLEVRTGRSGGVFVPYDGYHNISVAK